MIFRRNLACWHFGVGTREELQTLTSSGLDEWLAAALRRCTEVLGDFATESGRDDRSVRLDLSLVDARGEPHVIEDGAELRVQAWRGDDGELDMRRVYPVELILALHVDAAVPRDDSGRTNGARLSAFLARLEGAGPADLFGIEAPGYEATACARGFQAEDSIGRAC